MNLFDTVRRFAERGPVVAPRGVALHQANVGPTEVDLRGTVAADFAAERADYNDVVARKGFDPGWHGARTPLASDDKYLPAAAERLAGEVRHGRILGHKNRARPSLVVDARRDTRDCVFGAQA
jgi:hypothetical protein